jgi:hypothetical protein
MNRHEEMRRIERQERQGRNGAAVRFPGLCLGWMAVVILSARLVAESPVGHPSAGEIMDRFLRRAREAAEVEARHVLTYRRVTRVEDLDATGAASACTTKEHSVTNAAGRVRAVLVRVDDRAPSESEVSADARRENDARRETGRRRRGPDFIDAGLVRRFDYAFDGEEVVEGRRAWRLVLVPKAGGADTGKNMDRFLALVQGRIWIDAEDYELVRASAGLREPLKILGGFAATVSRMELSIARRPIAPGYWSNVLFTTRAEGRKFLSAFRVRATIEHDGFRLEPVTRAVP